MIPVPLDAPPLASCIQVAVSISWALYVIVMMPLDTLAFASRIASRFDIGCMVQYVIIVIAPSPLTLASGAIWIRRISHCLSLTGLASADGVSRLSTRVWTLVMRRTGVWSPAVHCQFQTPVRLITNVHTWVDRIAWIQPLRCSVDLAQRECR
jgi:hypothetical protein